MEPKRMTGCWQEGNWGGKSGCRVSLLAGEAASRRVYLRRRGCHRLHWFLVLVREGAGLNAAATPRTCCETQQSRTAARRGSYTRRRGSLAIFNIPAIILRLATDLKTGGLRHAATRACTRCSLGLRLEAATTGLTARRPSRGPAGRRRPTCGRARRCGFRRGRGTGASGCDRR